MAPLVSSAIQILHPGNGDLILHFPPEYLASIPLAVIGFPMAIIFGMLIKQTGLRPLSILFLAGFLPLGLFFYVVTQSSTLMFSKTENNLVIEDHVFFRTTRTNYPLASVDHAEVALDDGKSHMLYLALTSGTGFPRGADGRRARATIRQPMRSINLSLPREERRVHLACARRRSTMRRSLRRPEKLFSSDQTSHRNRDNRRASFLDSYFSMNPETTKKEPRSRLDPIPEQGMLPIRKSTEVTVCSLYWIPVSDVPVYGREMYWLRRFFDELHVVLTKENKLRQESFLQMKLASPLGHVKDTLHKNQMRLMPLMGLGRKPQGKLPPIPTEEDLEPIMKGKAKFDFNEYVADYIFWFLERDEQWKRELFLGYGGYTMIYLPPDPATTPPPIPDYPAVREMQAFKHFDMDSLWQATFLLGDSFREKSKKVFGKGLEEEASFEGLTFILPYWRARDFQAVPADELAEWFTVFDVFITESPDDRGILVVSKDDLDTVLIEIMEKMRQDGDFHPLYEVERKQS